MGSTVAAGYADAVAEGMCDLSAALDAHLRTNHWPPQSQRLIPFAAEAVGLAAAGEWDAEVALPDGITLEHRVTGRRHHALPVGEVVEWLHLGAFVEAAMLGDSDDYHTGG